MGRRATEILLRKIEHDKDGTGAAEDHLVVLPNELRIRDSTAAPYSVVALRA
jgi:DNA-binding LacI/PurR family transcriptional regulator